jgi:hypothetical protein
MERGGEFCNNMAQKFRYKLLDTNSCHFTASPCLPFPISPFPQDFGSTRTGVRIPLTDLE